MAKPIISISLIYHFIENVLLFQKQEGEFCLCDSRCKGTQFKVL